MTDDRAAWRGYVQTHAEWAGPIPSHGRDRKAALYARLGAAGFVPIGSGNAERWIHPEYPHVVFTTEAALSVLAAGEVQP